MRKALRKVDILAMDLEGVDHEGNQLQYRFTFEDSLKRFWHENKDLFKSAWLSSAGHRLADLDPQASGLADRMVFRGLSQ